MYTDYSSECLPLLLAHRSSLHQGRLFFRQTSQLRLLFSLFAWMRSCFPVIQEHVFNLPLIHTHRSADLFVPSLGCRLVRHI